MVQERQSKQQSDFQPYSPELADQLLGPLPAEFNSRDVTLLGNDNEDTPRITDQGLRKGIGNLYAIYDKLTLCNLVQRVVNVGAKPCDWTRSSSPEGFVALLSHMQAMTAKSV